MDETVESVLFNTYNSIDNAKNYSPDSPNSPASEQVYDKNTKSIVEQVDHGNGVVTKETVAQPTWYGETARVGVSLGFDIVDETGDVYADLDSATNHLLTKTHPILGYSIYKSQDFIKRTKNRFDPKTETGIAVRDMASEISLMIANNTLLKKIKFLSGVPKYGQKFYTYAKNIAVSAFRWGVAEGTAAFVARDESEPFVLMITDLTGVTDENDLTQIRNIFKQGVNGNEPWDQVQKRLIFAADGFATGVAFETVLPILRTVYGSITGLAATKGFVEDQVQKETLQDMQNVDIENIIDALSDDTLTEKK